MKFRTGIILVGVLSIALTTSGIETILATEADTTEVSEVGVTTVDVEMSFTDEYGSYVPTDDFTVTIPKTFNINPKEDFVYDVTVQGNIDADRDVWVCTDDTVTMTLTDETLATAYGIRKTQTVSNVLDKIQYKSSEIVDGYTSQGTIKKSSLDYEVECSYSGSLNFYINVIDEDNTMSGSIQQNGYLCREKNSLINMIKKCLPEEAADSIDFENDQYINMLMEYANQSMYCLITVDIRDTYDYDALYKFNFYYTSDLQSYEITKSATVTNGKYYHTYKLGDTGILNSQYQTNALLQIGKKTDGTWETVNADENYSNKISGSITTSDTLDIYLYLSPRCKLIYE